MERAQARFERRKQAVAAVQNGESPKVVARVFGIGQRTLYDWLARYRHGGWDALREGRRSGRSRKAGPEVMQWLFEVVTQGDPYTHKFPFALWTLPIIMKLLKREHGIKLSKSSVSRLLQQLGLSPQRPVYRAYQRDPKALETYLNTTFPELKQRAQREGAAIYFVDESSVRSDHHRGTTWGEIGKTPVVADGGGRFSVHLVSAVSPRGDLRFQVIEGRMNADRFIDFLTKLRRDAGQPIIVIADNASYHKAKTVKTFCADPDNGVEVANLPAYAPELNPDEQVWNHAKYLIGKQFAASRKALKRLAINALFSIQKRVDLVRSFFHLETTRYVIETG